MSIFQPNQNLSRIPSVALDIVQKVDEVPDKFDKICLANSTL
jgi:hypothetical protein